MNGYRVLLADDHQLVRQGLRALLEAAGHDVVAEAADGREALALAKLHSPDVAVLDISMPLLNGLDVARALARDLPRSRVILLTMHTDRRYVTDSVKAGVKGYVLKSQAAEDLVRAIREVMRGSTYLSPAVMTTVVGAYLDGQDTTSEPLTPREREVLQLVAEGKTTKIIARILGVSYKTAETHRSHIMRKLDIHETAGLVRYAIRRGMLQA
jgi:two-component system response regulator NreC